MRKGYNGHTVQAVEGQISVCTESESYADNRELIALAQSGEGEAAMAATERLLEHNRGLVRTIVARFRDRGADMEDLMQMGTIGMLKAIRSFDLERGTCFSTYAVPLIFGEIRRYLRDEGPIKIGRYWKKLGSELTARKNRILSEEGREPHIGELARLCGVSPEEAAMAMDAMSPLVSLSDFVYGEEDGVLLQDTLADPEAGGEMERISDRIELTRAMAKMPDD
ncbi:MAG: sigma-70 family RNA polymerase sigma factor, partial [Clostridia bacterium]|nr:sigma-70 family RNA polymerase sigma factor [Clostridia bacterium]